MILASRCDGEAVSAPDVIERGDALLGRLVERRGDADSDANELLKSVFRGYPIENLRELLRNDDPEVAKSGVWITSELGARAKPLIEDVIPLLKSPIPYARFFAIDSILSCADWDDGDAVAAVIRLIDDPDAGVRWKVAQFLIHASKPQLESASPLLEGDYAMGLRCLLDEKDIEQLLKSDSAAVRKMAFAAAVRAAGAQPASLQAAAASTDEEVRAWAAEESGSVTP